MKSFVVCGLNYLTAPLALREQLAFNQHALDIALHALLHPQGEAPWVDEAVLLSTCNRTELYAITDTPACLVTWLADFHSLPEAQVAPCCYQHQDQAAISHVLAVTCGLDSHILGEPQITGQVKSAFRQAYDMKAAGQGLGRIFPAVFAASKEIRHATRIGSCPVSLAYALFKKAQAQIPDLLQGPILLIGAGETIGRTAQYLSQRGARQVTLANRSQERAIPLMQMLSCPWVPLHEIPQYLPDTRLVVSATASEHPLITYEVLAHAREKTGPSLSLWRI